MRSENGTSTVRPTVEPPATCDTEPELVILRGDAYLDLIGKALLDHSFVTGSNTIIRSSDGSMWDVCARSSDVSTSPRCQCSTSSQLRGRGGDDCQDTPGGRI